MGEPLPHEDINALRIKQDNYTVSIFDGNRLVLRYRYVERRR